LQGRLPTAPRYAPSCPGAPDAILVTVALAVLTLVPVRWLALMLPVRAAAALPRQTYSCTRRVP